MNKVFVIAGMHRSGTSFLSNILFESGVEIGGNLIEGREEDNKYGYFEDNDIVEFQEYMINNRGFNFLNFDEKNIVYSKIENRFFEWIIKKRNKGDGKIWGWKDPRTVLFLDKWKETLENNASLDIYYIIPFRNPFEVWMSLLKRKGQFRYFPQIGLDAWVNYNNRLINFIEKNPSDKILLFDIRDLINDFKGFREFFYKKTGHSIKVEHFMEVFDENEFHSNASDVHITDSLVNELNPDVFAVHKKLEEMRGFIPEDDNNKPPLDALYDIPGVKKLYFNLLNLAQDHMFQFEQYENFKLLSVSKKLLERFKFFRVLHDVAAKIFSFFLKVFRKIKKIVALFYYIKIKI